MLTWHTFTDLLQFVLWWLNKMKVLLVKEKLHGFVRALIDARRGYVVSLVPVARADGQLRYT